MNQITPIKMFNNYNELFQAYLSFMSGDLFDSSKDTNEKRSDARFSSLLKSNQTNQTVLYRKYDQPEALEEIAPAGPFIGPDSRDYLHVTLVFFFLLLAKYLLTKKLQQSSYLDKLALREKDRQRLDESVWRLLYYSFSSIWLIYSCFFKHQSQSLFDSQATYSSYSFDITWDEYWICIIECAFYLHGTYAILFEDVWRRDSPMMLLHHLAATFSFVCLYGTRTHRIGLAAVVLRDTCDVLLEVFKTASCFRVQRDQLQKSSLVATKCCFSIFTVSFLVNQLYYYPLFCIYHFLNVTRLYRIQSAIWTTQISCLFVFLMLDLLWSVLIVKLCFRLLFTTGQVDDPREYDAHEIAELQRATLLADKNTKVA